MTGGVGDDTRSLLDDEAQRINGNTVGRGAHPAVRAAHLYSIGDGALIRNDGGESCLAIARMKHFGAHQT